MPISAPVTCDYPACGAIAEPHSRYCSAHQKPQAVAEENRANERNRNRKEPWRKWYHTAHWRKLRGTVLARDPICKICKRVASNVADHIRPHRGIWALFCDLANLQGLCEECHNRKTATEDGGGGNPIADPNAPKMTGDSGKQFTATIVGDDALDRALAEEI